jgi:hypothetical protein
LTKDDLGFIVLGMMALAFVGWRLRGGFRDFWEHPLHTLASTILLFAAVFLFGAFYGTGRYGPSYPHSPFRYFAWAVCLMLLIGAVWVDARPSRQVRQRLKRRRAFRRAASGPRL